QATVNRSNVVHSLREWSPTPYNTHHERMGPCLPPPAGVCTMNGTFPWRRPTPWLLGAVALLALGLQVRPAAAQAKKVIKIEGVTEYQLANGVRVLLLPDQAASNVTVNMTVLV